MAPPQQMNQRETSLIPNIVLSIDLNYHSHIVNVSKLKLCFVLISTFMPISGNRQSGHFSLRKSLSAITASFPSNFISRNPLLITHSLYEINPVNSFYTNVTSPLGNIPTTPLNVLEGICDEYVHD